MNSIKVVEVFWANQQVGRLAQTNDGICAFEYHSSFLLSGTSISPLQLPLNNGVFFAKQSPFYGNFGVFDDCLPDGWGLLILDRYLQKQGLNIHTLTIPDRLSLVGSKGRGALEFRPDKSLTSSCDYISFELLAAEAERILSSSSYLGEGIDNLYKHGGSPGGARPKIFSKINGIEWLIKFRANNDPLNIGEIEYNYSILAKKCGIEMPETQLFEGKHFGVARFDRTTQGKVHVVSVAGLLNADYRLPCIDYLHIFQLCQKITHNEIELWKVYRLMVFNYLIGNKDDHAKNFAFIWSNNEWHFAPAFDILPSNGINGYRTTSINGSIDPTANDLFVIAQKSGLELDKAVVEFNNISNVLKCNLNSNN